MKILIITTSVLLLHSAFAEQLPVPNWKMLESMDSNKNDLISRDEFLSSNKVFNFIDQNKDQQLSEKELDIARKSTPAAPKVGEFCETVWITAKKL